MAFITDIDRKKLLAIGQDPSGGSQAQQSQAAYNNQQKAKKLTEENIATNNLPKFEDD
jgi:hypothetical protein